MRRINPSQRVAAYSLSSSPIRKHCHDCEVHAISKRQKVRVRSSLSELSSGRGEGKFYRSFQEHRAGRPSRHDLFLIPHSISTQIRTQQIELGVHTGAL